MKQDVINVINVAKNAGVQSLKHSIMAADPNLDVHAYIGDGENLNLSIAYDLFPSKRLANIELKGVTDITKNIATNITVTVIAEYFSARDESPELSKREKQVYYGKLLRDFNRAKNLLSVELSSTEKLRDEGDIDYIPHKEYADMTLLYKLYPIDYNKQNYGITVTNAMLNAFGISAEELHEAAFVNARKRRPEVINSLGDCLGMSDVSETLIVTVDNMRNGAVALFYPGVMSSVAEKLGQSFWVLPSSIHEVLCMPETFTSDKSPKEAADMLISMVTDVNNMEVQEEDQLTYNAYHFDVSSGIFETAREYADRV